MDRFRVEVISKTDKPQQVIYAALHQDYTEAFVYDQRHQFPSEAECGEIIVKRLLAGDRGHFGCYSEDTEVLTSRGWVLWSEVKESDELAAINITSNQIQFEKPKALQVYDHDGWMYSLQGIALDTIVTLDHRMVICHRQKSGQFTPYYFTTAANVVGKPVRYMKTGWLIDTQRSRWDNPWNIDKINFAKLVGFFIGDGSAEKRNSIRFNLRLKRKIDFLCNLDIQINQSNSEEFSIVLEGLGQWFMGNCYDEEGNKVLPEGYLTLSAPEVEGLLEGLRNSDGTNVSNSWSYDSTSLKLINQIQALAHINNLSANFSVNNPNLHNPNHGTGYRLHFSNRNQPRVEICQKARSRSYEERVIEYKGKVYCATVSTGALLVRRNMKVMVSGNCIEHPQIVFNCGYFPHSVMQQARTHRVAVSFDVQSFRYTSNQFVDVIAGKKDIEDVFYLRPVGYYSDRQGKKYYYSPEQRENDLQWCLEAAKRYQADMDAGMSEEHARGKVPFDYRQHFIVSFNLRSVLHFLDLRWKANAQLEIIKLCDLMWPHVEEWTPSVAEWYKNSRAKKAKLSP
jgi:thymidylate synthase (FAD)